MTDDVQRIAADIKRELSLNGYDANDGDVTKALIAVAAQRVADHANDRTELCKGAQIFGELTYYGVIGFGDKRIGLNS